MKAIPTLLADLPLDGLIRIDAGLEGDWSPSMVTVWTRGNTDRNYSRAAEWETGFKPSLEFYFPGAWLGIHCFHDADGCYRFDREFADRIIDFVEEKLV